MEQVIEDAITRVKAVYEQVTGQPAPEATIGAPYARIPPEVDAEEHVLRRAAMLFEQVQQLGGQKPSVGGPVPPTGEINAGIVVTVPPAFYTVAGGADEAVLVFELPGVPKSRVGVELRGTALHIFGDKSLPAPQVASANPAPLGGAANVSPAGPGGGVPVVQSGLKTRFERWVGLPVPVDPANVRATFADGVLTVSVPTPRADERIHNIEVR